MHRPRSGMARMLYEKILIDDKLQSMDKSQWYKINTEMMRTLSPEIGDKFVQFEIDESTQRFLDTCVQNSDNTFWQLWLTLASSVLSWFLTNTSVNGLLGRGSMQVFSSNQFERLINHQQRNRFCDEQTKLLDIGAGDGSTTDRMAEYFKDVYVTEMSTTMRWTLQKKGYHVLDVTEWASDNNTKFDVISCLNVLDRCEKPLTLLSQIKNSLKSDGIAVLAFVIPFKPYVEFENKDHEPIEKIDITGNDFESEVKNFIETVLTPQGFEVVRWTRLPYLCEGNIQQAFYWLDDAIFVVKPMERFTEQSTSSGSCPNPTTSFYMSDDR